MNLSLNAIEAVGNRGQVDISCAKVVVDELSAAAVEGAYPGCFIKIQVTDDGEGIAPKIRPDIFKPFSTTKAKGGGLGLYTVAKITERLGGFLQVEEPPKGGAAIAVYLPSADPLTTEEKPKPLCPIRGEDRLVLLHERNSEMRAALKFNLEKHGLPVKEAEDGADLLHQFMVNGSSVGLLICSSTGDIDGTEIIRGLPQVPAGCSRDSACLRAVHGTRVCGGFKNCFVDQAIHGDGVQKCAPARTGRAGAQAVIEDRTIKIAVIDDEPAVCSALRYVINNTGDFSVC